MATGYLNLWLDSAHTRPGNGGTCTASGSTNTNASILYATIPEEMYGALFTSVSLTFDDTGSGAGHSAFIRFYPYTGDVLASGSTVVGNDKILQRLVNGDTEFGIQMVLQKNSSSGYATHVWNNIQIQVVYEPSASLIETNPPVFNSVVWTDQSSCYSNYGSYVQHGSNLRCTINVSLDTITDPNVVSVSRQLVMNGVVYEATGNVFNIGSVASRGTVSYVITVTDNHGITGSYSGTIELLSYDLPALSTLTIERYNIDDNLPDDGSPYVWVSYAGAISSMTAGDGWHLNASWTNGAITESTEMASGTGTTLSASRNKTCITQQISDAYDWTFTITLSDSVSSISYEYILSKGGGIFNIEHHGVAVGKRSTGTAQNPKFEVAYDASFEGDVSIAGDVLISGQSLAEVLDRETPWIIGTNAVDFNTYGIVGSQSIRAKKKNGVVYLQGTFNVTSSISSATNIDYDVGRLTQTLYPEFDVWIPIVVKGTASYLVAVIQGAKDETGAASTGTPGLITLSNRSGTAVSANRVEIPLCISYIANDQINY